MKKYHLLTILVSFFILLPQITYAECTQEEIKHFKKIEDEYKITYKYNQDTDDYNVTFYNPEPDSYDFKVYIEENINCNEINDKESKCNNIKEGLYTIQIVGITDSCKDVLKEYELEVGLNNKYSNDPLCEGIEDFVLCDPLYDKDITREEFESRIATYKRTLENKEAEENNQKKKKTDNKIIKYIEENLVQIIIIIIFVIMVTITIILTAKSIRKSRRLE